MQLRHILIICFLGLYWPNKLIAQIQAPNADYSDTAQYNGGGPDSVFVFNVDNNDRYLMVELDSFPGYTASWQEFQKGVGFVDLGITTPQIDIPDSKTLGYKLQLIGSDTLESICWVVENDFSMRIVTKDEDNNILKDALRSGDCIFIGYIEVEFLQDVLEYYHPSIDTSYVLELDYSSDYETDKELPSGGVGRLLEADRLDGFLRFGISNSWWEDALYTIIITDDAGLERSDSLMVTAIRPKAIIQGIEYILLTDTEFYPDRDTLYYRAYDREGVSAPALYHFESASVNVDSLMWSFGDSNSFTTSRDTVLYEYTKWGNYIPSLRVVNYFDFRKECYDEEVWEVLEVSSANLESEEGGKAPNVFSPPNGDNPIWRLDDVSITYFEIAIYGRYGTRVHHFKGNIRDWGGWDGTRNNSSNYVSTGVYFYVIKEYQEAPSFNNESSEIDQNIKKGFIHVFNTE